ncbi:hypothetical protein BKA81DRAFT_111582 [Phyllosticta paracitricarpa]
MTGRQPPAIGDGGGGGGGGGGGLWRITNSRSRRLGSDCSQPPIGSWSWWLWPSGLPHCSSPPSRVRHRRPRGSKGRGPCALCYAHPGDRPGSVVGSIRQLGIWLRALSEPVQWDDEQRRLGTNFDSPAFAKRRPSLLFPLLCFKSHRSMQFPCALPTCAPRQRQPLGVRFFPPSSQPR